MMNNYILYKVIFFISLLMSALAIHDMFNASELLKPIHPSFISVSLTVSDTLMLVGCFCVAWRKKIFNVTFWKATVGVYLCSAFAAMYYEYSAGGYSSDQLINHSILSLTILALIAFPVVKHLEDFK